MRICLTEAEQASHKGHSVLASQLGWPDEGTYFARLKKFLDQPSHIKYVANITGPGQAIINAVSTVIIRSWGHWADSEMGLRHIFSNLATIKKSPQVFVEEASAAIWCASGPSLDSNRALVEAASKAGIFVCCPDASLKTLLNWGVIPQMVFSTERGIETRDLLLKAIKGREELLKDVWLNASIYLHPDSIKAWPGRTTFHFRKQAEAYFLFPEITDGSPNALTPLPHVAMPSLDWLIKRGFKELILVGQDLAYGAKGETHTETHKDEWLESLDRYECDLNDGSKGVTNSYWAEWALDLSNLFLAHEKEVRVYNTSLKGVRLQGSLIVEDIKDFEKWISGLSFKHSLREEKPVSHRDLREMLGELKRYQPDILTEKHKFWDNKVALFLGFPLAVRDYSKFQVESYREELEGKRPKNPKLLRPLFRRVKALLIELITKTLKGESVLLD